MAATFNRVIIIGNLGKDPEVRYTSGGKAVVTLSVATNERWKDSAGKKQERTDWHQVVVWGPQAETIGKYLKKGQQALFEGRLQNREYEKNGQKHTVTEIQANRWNFIGSAKRPEGEDVPVEDLGEAPPDDGQSPPI
jgi:single-strand DNA-binding protein